MKISINNSKANDLLFQQMGVYISSNKYSANYLFASRVPQLVSWFLNNLRKQRGIEELSRMKFIVIFLKWQCY